MIKSNLSYFSKIFFLILFFTNIQATISNVYWTPDDTQIIQHKIIKKSIEKQSITIDVLINEDYSNIKNVILHYKSPNQINYLEKNMIHTRDNFFYAVIPESHVTNSGLEYYIFLELKNNKLYSYPYKNPKNNPILVKINKIDDTGKKSKSKFSDNGDIQILSPLPNSRVLNEDLFISLSYFKLKNINKDETRVFLNNRDITTKITFYDNYFIYKPDFILDGSYKIDVIFTDKYDRELDPFNWSFTVISKDKLAGLSTLFNQSARINNTFSINENNTERLETKNLKIDHRMNFDFLKIRNKVKVSSLSSDYEQDKNRYLSSIKAPYVDLKIGDSYPYINQYVLNGYRVRGLNLEIDTKFFDFHIIQGELSRAIEGNPIEDAIVISNLNTNVEESIIDSTLNGQYDQDEDFTDENGNGIWDAAEGFTDDNDNGVWDEGEEFDDTNGNGVWDDAENFTDSFLNQYIYQYDTTYVMDFSRDNYTFKRNIYGFDIGIGNSNKILWNLSIVKAEDNLNTISRILNNMPNHIINLPEDYHNLINEENKHYFSMDTTITDNDCSIDTTINYLINYNTLIDSFNFIFDNDYTYNILSDNWIGETPKDNLVISSNIKMVFDDLKMVFNSGASLSLLNQNTWDAGLSMDILDTLLDDNIDGKLDNIDLPDINFSDYEDIFKFSFDQVPLLPYDLISTDQTVFEKIITMPSLAWNVDFSYRYFNHNISFGIKQVGPEYYSLGNPYIQRDIREHFIADKFKILNNRLFVNLGFKRIEDGIELKKSSLSKTDRYDLAFNYYPGHDLPTYSISFKLLNRDNGIDSLDIFTEEIDFGLDSTITDTTYISNRRENTQSFQTNFNISYNYKSKHNFLLNLSQLNKKDILFDENISFDPLYFSPRVFNQTVVLNLRSKWSKIWTSNITLNHNYYNYGNNDYYQEQVLKQLAFKIYYYKLKRINLIQIGTDFSLGEGYFDYYQISSNFTIKLELIKNLFFDLNYQYKYRDMLNNSYHDQYFFIKTSYNF